MNEYIPNTNTYFHEKAKVKEDRKINYIYSIFFLDFHNMSLIEDILSTKYILLKLKYNIKI
jgi:hypothetical protein